jgi:hypothetical protein
MKASSFDITVHNTEVHMGNVVDKVALLKVPQYSLPIII